MAKAGVGFSVAGKAAKQVGKRLESMLLGQKELGHGSMTSVGFSCWQSYSVEALAAGRHCKSMQVEVGSARFSCGRA